MVRRAGTAGASGVVSVAGTARGAARNVEPATGGVGVDVVPAALPADLCCLEDFVWAILLGYCEWCARDHSRCDENEYRPHKGISGIR